MCFQRLFSLDASLVEIFPSQDGQLNDCYARRRQPRAQLTLNLGFGHYADVAPVHVGQDVTVENGRAAGRNGDLGRNMNDDVVWHELFRFRIPQFEDSRLHEAGRFGRHSEVAFD